MEKEMIIRTLKAVALKNGVPVQEVIRQIDAAIAEAMRNAEAENNRMAMNAWMCMAKHGKIPSAIEAVDYLSGWVYDVKDAEKP